jgi:hypothetical protein
MASLRPLQASLLVVSSLFLAACGEEKRVREADVEDVIEAEDGKTDAIWLRANDHIDPAQWLASREAGRELAATDAAVDKMRAAILAARRHFIESHRMLANRTAQIGRMLADEGKVEDYGSILYALTDVAKAAGQRQTYGELCRVPSRRWLELGWRSLRVAQPKRFRRWSAGMETTPWRGIP